jgi:hypothetical protein
MSRTKRPSMHEGLDAEQMRAFIHADSPSSKRREIKQEINKVRQQGNKRQEDEHQADNMLETYTCRLPVWALKKLRTVASHRKVEKKGYPTSQQEILLEGLKLWLKQEDEG